MKKAGFHSSSFKAIVRHASPVLVAQLASISTSVIDTLVAGRAGTTDLAVVGIGNGLYISVMLAGAGIVQALTPIAAHHYGAKQFSELRLCFQQCIWLSLVLAAIGIAILSAPNWILNLNHVSEDVLQRTREYLSVIAWSLPGTLIYRACGGMFNALGRPRILMYFGLANAASHAALAPSLALGWWGTPPLGATGCAASMLINTTLLASAGLFYLAYSSFGQQYQLLQRWSLPQTQRLKELLKLGLPIGMSTFVEMTSFALTSVLVAALGASQVGANRVISNYIGICYMLPLAISIATLSLVGQASGAGNAARVRQVIKAGLTLGCFTSVLVGTALWYIAAPLTQAYTPALEVQNTVLALIPLVVFNQFFDSMQTIAAQSLRGLKIAKWPMLIHVLCFWGIGLAGGWWLCYHGASIAGIESQGVAGFWQASLIATMLASILFGALLLNTVRTAQHQ